jgi:phage terminase small subunit
MDDPNSNPHLTRASNSPSLPELPHLAVLDPLTAREAVFVHWYVETRNVMQAYRQSFDVGANTKTSSVYTQASEVLRRPHIRRAIAEAQDKAAQETIVRAAQMLQDLVDIADADPNELIKVETFNCRHCRGVDFKWQWADAMELARAVDEYMVKFAEFEAYKGKKPPPRPRKPADASGGFGFVLKGEPSPACPHCYGDGIRRETVGDTTRLSPRARKLYKGAKVKADGSIEILMHDQIQARDMVIKMLGAYKDGRGIQGQGTGGDAQPIAEGATADEAQRAYLKLVQS